MTRRALCLLPVAALLRADSEHDVVNAIGSVVEALSAGRLEMFLDGFDPSMKGLAQLRADVAALIGQADLQCSIEVLSNEGDDAARSLELDWILRIEHKPGAAGSTRRQRTVKCGMRKTGRKWRIVSFEPLDMFTPPKA